MPRWTDEARKNQSEIQKTRQSWKHSTGPKTVAGKQRASRNAYKHGLRSHAAFEMRASLRHHSKFLTYINRYITAVKRKRKLLAALNFSPSPLWGEGRGEGAGTTCEIFTTPSRKFSPHRGEDFLFASTPAIKASCFP